ncbi:MAG TPA: RNase A-like domain-containing protein [Jatrophihabitans sp.]|nr:RNase A-like domain-containing protein [Jatrophihabitans sp.]
MNALSQRSLPMLDAGVVWPLAGWAGGIAAELGWLRGVLTGPLGTHTGWAGTAELACAEAMAGQSAQVAGVVERFEGYAATLAGYARELELLGPRLTGAHRRLEAQRDDAVAAADFDRWWREWDAARSRCVAGLRATGAGVGHRHWWSALADDVSRVVAPSVSLAGLSRVLSDVGQGLVIAGLVCALVCPPLAGAVWAAVAVVAICQVVVDGARRARGESVGWGALGMDALGAVPAGRWIRAGRVVVRDWESVAEADAAIERLPVRLRSSPVVPGGLKAHEGSATYRGHTILKHLGKTRAELVDRFRTEPELEWSSSFHDRQVAEAAIAAGLDNNRQAIRAWLRQPMQVLRFEIDIGTEVGRSIARDGTMVGTSKLRVVLRKEDTMLGYYIKTAYPTP